MMGQQRNGLGTAWTVILAVLLVIILRAALESFFSPLIGGRTLRQLYEAWPPSDKTWLRVGQLVVFLMLLARFYGGAYRYNQEQPPTMTMGMTIFNLFGTFGLFSLFYVISVNLWTTDLFYALILGAHIFDAIWFGVILWRLERGSALIDPVKYFLLLDLVTFVAYLVLSLIFWRGFWDGSHLLLQVSLLSFLFAISLADWGVLWNFYFRPEKWRQQ